jgi:hypothetical protein
MLPDGDPIAVRAELAGLPFVVCSLKPRSATPRRHHS